jgi:MtN3 and saliva related transmembrane protein
VKEAVAFIFGLGMVLNAALFVPQALHLWRTKTAQGVSILSFAGFNALQAIGALHGYFQHDYALMIGMFASLATCGSVTALAAHYSKGRADYPAGSRSTDDRVADSEPQ